MLITSQIEYEATMLLIQEMSGALEDTLEERLLIRLVLSVEIWGAKQLELPQRCDLGPAPNERSRALWQPS
jgi:hypothetical protein